MGAFERLEALSTSEPGCKAGLCFVHHILAALPAPQLSWNPAFATCCYRQAEEGVPTVRETPASFLSPPPNLPFPPLHSSSLCHTFCLLSATPFFPVLQACVMSLSPDSWHVNEDVMRLTDMQLIWFPPLPCDDASIKGHGAHKKFPQRGNKRDDFNVIPPTSISLPSLPSSPFPSLPLRPQLRGGGRTMGHCAQLPR